MFGFFIRKRNYSCPVDENMRQWIDKALKWLILEFGEEKIKNRKILIPDQTDFPVNYNGEISTAHQTLKLVARQMELNPDDIVLNIYQEGQSEIDTGGVFGNKIFLKSVEGEKYSGGLYWGRHEEDNKFHIGLEKQKLEDPIGLIATLAHELSHVKLLGENRIEKNNEPLTDLNTVIFGLGIFNANAAFQTYTKLTSSGWSRLGYLSQMEWGYALALLAYFREEESPAWIEHLTLNVKSDFKQSMKFIYQNEEKLLIR